MRVKSFLTEKSKLFPAYGRKVLCVYFYLCSKYVSFKLTRRVYKKTRTREKFSFIKLLRDKNTTEWRLSIVIMYNSQLYFYGFYELNSHNRFCSRERISGFRF